MVMVRFSNFRFYPCVDRLITEYATAKSYDRLAIFSFNCPVRPHRRRPRVPPWASDPRAPPISLLLRAASVRLPATSSTPPPGPTRRPPPRAGRRTDHRAPHLQRRLPVERIDCQEAAPATPLPQPRELRQRPLLPPARHLQARAGRPTAPFIKLLCSVGIATAK